MENQDQIPTITGFFSPPPGLLKVNAIIKDWRDWMVDEFLPDNCMYYGLVMKI